MLFGVIRHLSDTFGASHVSHVICLIVAMLSSGLLELLYSSRCSVQGPLVSHSLKSLLSFGGLACCFPNTL